MGEHRRATGTPSVTFSAKRERESPGNASRKKWACSALSLVTPSAGTVLARPPTKGGPSSGTCPSGHFPGSSQGRARDAALGLGSGSAVGQELTLRRAVSPSSAAERRAGRRPGRMRSRPCRDAAARGAAQTRASVSRRINLGCASPRYRRLPSAAGAPSLVVAGDSF